MVARSARPKQPPETISAAELEARCLELIDTGAATGFMKGRIRILGDIVSPIDTTWSVDT